MWRPARDWVNLATTTMSHRCGQDHYRVTSSWLRDAHDGGAFAAGMLALASADPLVPCVPQMYASSVQGALVVNSRPDLRQGCIIVGRCTPGKGISAPDHPPGRPRL